MTQNNAHPRRGDFIWGLLLVPALHIAFAIIWTGVAFVLGATIPFFGHSYNFILLGVPLFFLGITQIAYLIPAYSYFANKQRWEVGKGLLAGGLLTALLSGICFGQMAGGIVLDPTTVAVLLGGTVAATAIGLFGRFLLNRRMGR
jgi:hypothetical protein